MPIMCKLNEIRIHCLGINFSIPIIRHKVFEDNGSVLEMSTICKFRPYTKHINAKLHCYYDYVTRGDVIDKAINTAH